MTALIWVGFLALILALLALDLRVTGRQGHVLTVGEALAWSSFYVLMALAFNGVVYLIYEYNWIAIGFGTADLSGRQASVQFFTAWLIEKSLSVDNIFVIALVFSYFGVRREHQHRVLFWGILGALVLRGILILAGSELLRRFEWTTYVFGAILLFTAARMLVVRHDNIDPGRNPLVRLAQRYLPVNPDYAGPRFLLREGGRIVMTRLFIALLVIEGFDLLFAVDSVPAALAVTTDPFIVFTSNIFAVLGLRALYFVLAGFLDQLRYLKASLVVLLAYVGVKMMLAHVYPIPTLVSLGVILGVLGVGVFASLLSPGADADPLESPLAEHLEDLLEVTQAHALGIVASLIFSTVLVFGLAATMAPGPGLPFAAVGMLLVVLELEWARRWLAKSQAERAGSSGD